VCVSVLCVLRILLCIQFYKCLYMCIHMHMSLTWVKHFLVSLLFVRRLLSLKNIVFFLIIELLTAFMFVIVSKIGGIIWFIWRKLIFASTFTTLMNKTVIVDTALVVRR